MKLLASVLLLAGVVIHGGTFSGGTISGGPSGDWAFRESGLGPGSVAVSASAGDFLKPYLIKIAAPSGTLNYTVAITGVQACPTAVWVVSNSGGGVVAGSDELHPIFFFEEESCVPGSYSATVTITDNAGVLDPQVFPLTATFGAAEAAGSYNMVTFGDSLTWGGSSTSTDWSVLLATRYRTAITNHAISGDDCTQVSTKLDTEITAGIPSASIGIIQCGTNDVTDAAYSEAATLVQVQEMVDDFQANGNTFLTLVAPPYVWPPASYTNCGGSQLACDARVDSLTTEMQTIATTEAIGFVSMRDVFGDLSDPELCFLNDGVHPGLPSSPDECADRTGIDVSLALDSVRPSGSASVTSSFTVSQSSGVSPLNVRVDATASTANGFTRDTARHCMHEWDFGDSAWPSGQGAYDYGTADSAYFTKNTDGFSPWSAHVYEEPVANWSVSDDTGTVKTITHTITCREDDGTEHTDSSTINVTVDDPLSVADVDNDDIDAEDARCIAPNGVAQASAAAPCNSTTVFPNFTVLSVANDLSAEIGTATERFNFVDHAADGTYKAAAARTIVADERVDVLGGDRKTSLTETSAGVFDFFTLNSGSLVAGLVPTSTDVLTPGHKGFQFATGSANAMVYRSGSSGIGAPFNSNPGGANVFVAGSDFDKAGIASSGNAFLLNTGGGTVILNSRIDQEGQPEHTLRLACATNGSVLAHFQLKDSPSNKNLLAYRDSCGTSSVDAVDSRVAWGSIVQTLGLDATFLSQFNPQNTDQLTSQWERHERLVYEGVIGHSTFTCGGSSAPQVLLQTSGRHSTYRHHVFIGNTVSCPNRTIRLQKQENLADKGIGAALDKVIPNYEPPAGDDGNDLFVAEQLGDNDSFHGIVVNETTNYNIGNEIFLDCKTSGGTADTTCGAVAGRLAVSDNGTIADEANGVESTTDPDTYFVNYADADAPGSNTVDDFKPLNPSAATTCSPKMFWKPDGTKWTHGSCRGGLY